VTDPQFYTVAALALRWDVSDDTVRREIADGNLSHVRVRRQLRVPADAVEEYETKNGLSRRRRPPHRVAVSGSLTRGTPF
jgi:excisionase family DNA binding protein